MYPLTAVFPQHALTRVSNPPQHATTSIGVQLLSTEIWEPSTPTEIIPKDTRLAQLFDGNFYWRIIAVDELPTLVSLAPSTFFYKPADSTHKVETFTFKE